jgi:hypothetical protein
MARGVGRGAVNRERISPGRAPRQQGDEHKGVMHQNEHHGEHQASRAMSMRA